MFDNRLTKFERVRVIGARATQIANGAPTVIEGLSDPIAIAKAELEQRVIPITITRTYPNGKTKTYRVSEMIYD